MTKDEVFQRIFDSPLMSSWHWFQWHFMHQLHGQYHPFSDAIATALSEVDEKIPGYAVAMIESLTTIAGKEKYVPHYEQLLQLLAELHVIRQMVSYEWPNLEGFEYEPRAPGSDKNPELSIKYNGVEIGIEVKSPSLITHINQRSANNTQVVSRVFDKDEIEKLPDVENGVTLPRDNPLKDFLVSANEKFQSFKEDNDNYFGVLVVVWDDFIYEPISALLHSRGGLFTESSFFIGEEGSPVTFPYIDGIVVIRHLHQLMRASRDEPLIDNCNSPFDYGVDEQFPQKAFIMNPSGAGVPEEALKALQAYTPTHEIGTEYTPKDIVWWL